MTASHANKLDNLAAKEELLLVQVKALAKEPDAHSDLRSRTTQEYLSIWQSYSQLALADSDAEALKRAIFIQWYGQAEPPILTGINSLPQPEQETNCELVARMLNLQTKDEEFHVMLSWYAYIADWCFSTPANLLPLIRRHQIVVPAAFASLKREYFTNRGTMGQYWISILTKKHARGTSHNIG